MHNKKRAAAGAAAAAAATTTAAAAAGVNFRVPSAAVGWRIRSRPSADYPICNRSCLALKILQIHSLFTDPRRIPRLSTQQINKKVKTMVFQFMTLISKQFCRKKQIFLEK